MKKINLPKTLPFETIQILNFLFRNIFASFFKLFDLKWPMQHFDYESMNIYEQQAKL